MADSRITQLPASSGLVSTDLVPVVDDPGGSPETQKATVQQVADALESIYVADGSFAVPGSIALGTDTTGNYVADVSGGTGVTVTHTPGEGSTPSVAIGQDVASSASPTFAGLTINGASIVMEGTTEDEYETTISVTDPTADRTITIPDATGTVALNGSIALGTDTTGNYVSDVSGGTGVTVTHTPGEGSTPSVAIGQDVAASASPTFAGLTINGASIVLEGTTADEYETTISVADPTADRTITIPDATGTVALNGSIALGTDTTGNYVSDVAAGSGISVSHTPGEGSTATVSPNVGGLSASSGLTSTDELMVLDDPGGTPTHEKATVAQVASAVQAIFDAANTYDAYGSASTAQTAAEGASIASAVIPNKGDLVVGDGNLGINYDALAVGANGTVLVADSGETLGLKYADKELITVPAEQTGSTYTLALTDKSSVVRMNSGSAQTVTVPPNASVAFPVGSQVIIVAMGAGAVTIAAGSGVTLRSKDSNLVIDGQYGMAACVKIASDEWVVTGQLTS